MHAHVSVLVPGTPGTAGVFLPIHLAGHKAAMHFPSHHAKEGHENPAAIHNQHSPWDGHQQGHVGEGRTYSYKSLHPHSRARGHRETPGPLAVPTDHLNVGIRLAIPL